MILVNTTNTSLILSVQTLHYDKYHTMWPVYWVSCKIITLLCREQGMYNRLRNAPPDTTVPLERTFRHPQMAPLVTSAPRVGTAYRGVSPEMIAPWELSATALV